MPPRSNNPLCWVALACLAIALAGCKKSNVFVPPPPVEVGVATPLRQAVTPVLQLTGNLAPFNQADLVARVQGVLQSITYADGSVAKQGDALFRR